MHHSRRAIISLALLQGIAGAARGEDTGIRIDCFRLRAPEGGRDIEQASDLHYGRLGDREGLWLVCDRNGRQSAGKLYRVSSRVLRAAEPGKAIVADEEIAIVPPRESWSVFAAANQRAGEQVLNEVRKRIAPAEARGDEPFLDLEAVTIGPSPVPPHDPRVFVVAEEPFSTVLELSLEGQGKNALARLTAVYAYAERADHQGVARNDGLEGLAFAGRPGRFYLAEEGTLSHTDEPKPLMMFRDPRLEVGELGPGRWVPDSRPSEELTAVVRACRKGAMQTLNGLAVLPDGRVLTVDRNGGQILRIDPRRRTAEPWLNLYDLGGKNLRELLADFPQSRRMPYVSIEGVAVDETGTLWLIDDPAIPEGWRESCLVRITGVRP